MTGFSYVGAAFLTWAGYPPEATLSPYYQIMLYLGLGVLLMVSLIYKRTIPFANFTFAALYGVMACLSFSGIQKWVNYNGSPDFLGVAMAAWDLAVAVALLDEAD